MASTSSVSTGRIIPARAGFTRGGGSPTRWGRDHPRSRGVYDHAGTDARAARGSSPLARGLRRVEAQQEEQRGIIPARAGFTTRRLGTSSPTPDHPRSRGVYGCTRMADYTIEGSSPLARGLLKGLHVPTLRGRIIPARAGFTSWIREMSAARSDHPRSRGVYTSAAGRVDGTGGSSPLARGLPRWLVYGVVCEWIIPARAGFTATSWSITEWLADHPRSRGVYPSGRPGRDASSGSSPLARGLRYETSAIQRAVRIIPARAGFTR